MFRYITVLLIGSFLISSCDTKLIDLRVKSQNGSVLECDPSIYGDSCYNSDDLILVKKDELNADNIKNGQTIGGVEGKVFAECSEDGEVGCVASTEYKAIDINNHKSKIISSESILGVSGNFVIPDSEFIPQSFSYGSEGKVSGTMPYCSNNGSGCYLRSYSEGVEGAQLKALDYDDIDSKKSNIKNGVELISGITGTQAGCSAGGNDCYIDESFKAVETSKLIASNIKHGVSIGGILGSNEGSYTSCSESVHTGCLTTDSYPSVSATLTSSLLSSASINGVQGEINDCSAGGSSCYVSDEFKAVETSKLLASNIKKDVVMGGVTGNYPSALYPLESPNDITDLTSTNFNSLMVSSNRFEWFDSKGNRYSETGDSDIVATNIRRNVDIFGVEGNYYVEEVDKVITDRYGFAIINADDTVSYVGNEPNSNWISFSSVQSQLEHVTGIYSTKYGGAFAAIKEGGAVVTWGSSNSGGNPSEAIKTQLSSGVTKIFSTSGAFAALKGESGSVVVWGETPDYYYSDCGGGPSEEIKAQISSGVTNIFSNDNVFVALKTGGAVVIWGGTLAYYDYGGSPSEEIKAELLSGVTNIFSSSGNNGGAFAALKGETGEVIVWGDPNYGGEPSETIKTQLSSGVTNIYSISEYNGGVFAALKGETGEVVVWGYSSYGGEPSESIKTKLSSGVTDIFCSYGNDGAAFSALKGGTGEVVVWGSYYYGGEPSESIKTKLSSDVTGIFPAIRGYHGGAIAVIKEGGSVVVWGDSGRGGEPSEEIQTKLSSGITNIVSTSYGYDNGAFAALKGESGSVVAWGHADFGGAPSEETQTQLLSGVTSIFSSGDDYGGAFVALKGETGSVVAWGHADYGGDTSQILGFTGSNSFTNIVKIYSYKTYFVGVRADGTYIAWGKFDTY